MLAISIVFSSRDSGLIISFHIEIVSTRPPRKNYNWSDLWKLYQVVPWETNGKLQLWRAVVRRPLAGSRRQTVEVEAAGSPSPFARRKVIREACQGGGSALFVQRGQMVCFQFGGSMWYRQSKLKVNRPEESNKKKHLESWFDNECFASRKILTELSNKKVNIPILLMKL